MAAEGRRLAALAGATALPGLTPGSVHRLVCGVVLKPLTYSEPARLVLVGHQWPEDDTGIPAAGDVSYAERATILSARSAWSRQQQC